MLAPTSRTAPGCSGVLAPTSRTSASSPVFGGRAVLGGAMLGRAVLGGAMLGRAMLSRCTRSRRTAVIL
jgi:hypothetical protein